MRTVARKMQNLKLKGTVLDNVGAKLSTYDLAPLVRNLRLSVGKMQHCCPY